MTADASHPVRTGATEGLSLSRRRFLQAALATGGTATLLNGPLGGIARAAEPLGPADPILVLVQLVGGNDGLNTVIPMTDAAYRAVRPQINLAPAALPLARGLGLHPALTGLKAQWDQGRLAIVQGAGKTDGDLSHFSSTATWMAGTSSGTDRSTGWIGRYLDTLADGSDGLRGVVLGSSIPLQVVGTRAAVTALPASGQPFGANRAQEWERRMFWSIAAYGAAPTGLGPWGDALAANDTAAINRASTVAPLFPSGATPPSGVLTPQLDLAARLINLNLGVKVVSASFGSFDTHDDQLNAHAGVLTDLDRAISRFFTTLDPVWADQVVIVTYSEFGRRVEQNSSRGTDHGGASTMFVLGPNVKGGLYGTRPSLTDLDTRGDLKTTVDFRRVYASVLARWLGADPAAVLGKAYTELDLFRAGPGQTVL
ncbi:MAG: DUF1501 domain-containing protein [Actinobacteria bacterium]|nr:DUF1501 domain-containing protein [Actinomycetota bacterium]